MKNRIMNFTVIFHFLFFPNSVELIETDDGIRNRVLWTFSVDNGKIEGMVKIYDNGISRMNSFSFF